MSVSRGLLAADDAQVTTLQASDLADCLRLVCSSFGEFDGRQDAIERWFAMRISRNPWQPAISGVGVGIRRGGELVAARTMFAQPWWINGRSTVVAFAAHTAVHPALRGMGVGTRLIEASCALAPITGSTSAGNITQRSYARLGFTPIGGDDNGFFRVRTSYRGSLTSRFGAVTGATAAKVLDAALQLRQVRMCRTSGFKVEPVGRCDEEFDRLWLRVRSTEMSCLERGSAFLNWRIFDCPTAALRLTAVRDRSGTLRAAATWSTVNYSRDVSVSILRDLVYSAADDEVALKALCALLAYWRDLGFTWSSFEVTSRSLGRLYARLGFEPVPSRGNRYWIYSRSAIDSAALNQWFRSGLDGDYADLGL